MPKLTIHDLDRELRNKTLRPVYFIYGAEGYLVSTAIGRVREYVKNIAGDSFEPDRFSGKDSDLAEITSCAGTLPMWTTHSLILVTEADKMTDTKPLAKYLLNPSKTSTIVFSAEKADGRTGFAKILSDKAAVIECKPLYDDKLPDWVRMEASNRGRQMSMEAANIMADLVGNNLGELAGAIDKIMLYIGKKKTIDMADVETVLTETGRKNVFEFTEAVGRRDLKESLRLLKRLFDFNENEIMILSMLARHFRILIKAKEATMGKYVDRASLPKLLGVNPFFVDKYVAQSKMYQWRELKKTFKRLYQTDKLLKSSKLPKETILERCVRELITAG
ncbi:MAG: DNA polymerase III subunit delta [Deltaproteobacteria bacterium CG11_big_fil_rev_8_21_14_0_20_49_13]|nr:MAG: DNA polymerase III subunit delta [Deltaproteobacteria bacterium CG11_big_fil_rev_8_21_14_0_20_49_13]